MQEPLAEYAFRRSVLEKERRYSLYEDRIVVTGEDIQPRTHLLRDVRSVRLKYEHSKQREYYKCLIDTHGVRVNLRHLHYESFGTFTDRRTTYTPFVKAVLAQLAPYPGVRYRAGSAVDFVAAIIGVPVMTFLCWLAWIHGREGSAMLAGLMLTICALMLGRSRPRRFDPLAPPEDVLPV